MRNLAIAYALIGIWTCGWVAGRFGLTSSLFVVTLLSVPALIAWPMLAQGRTTKLREYALCSATILAIGGTGVLISAWIENGLDRRAMFDREYRQFINYLSSTSDYKNVKASFTYRKGGRVYLHGYVPNKESHSRLIQKYERMVRNNNSGYYDGVDYPGKLSETETMSAK